MTGHRLVLVALLVGGLLVAGCSSGSPGPGVASIGSSKSPSASSTPSGSARDRALAYSQCMRSHGVPDFPDPDANGNLQVQGKRGSDLDPDSSKWHAAQEACKSLQPAGSPEQQASARANALKYSQCMRAHGIKDFPDPDSQGGIRISSAPGGDLDPNNPQFKAADKACASLRDSGKTGSGQ